MFKGDIDLVVDHRQHFVDLPDLAALVLQPLVVAADHTTRIAENIRDDVDGERYEATANGYAMKLYLPNISKDAVSVNLSGADVIVKIGNYKRNIPMPNTLRGMEVTSARYDEDTLVIQFEKLLEASNES